MKFRVYIYCLLALYIICSTLRVITTKLTDLHVTTLPDGSTTTFRHPVFQTMAGFVGELMVACIWAIWFMLTYKKPISFSKTPLYIFIIPGMCDLLDTLTFNIGMTQVSPSITTMVRSMVSPASALLSYFLIKARFSWAQIFAIVMVISGVLTACFVQLFYETEQDQFILTASGLGILCISSMFQALQAVIEQGIFMRDPGLSPWPLCGAEAVWKLIILLFFSPFYKKIPVPTAISQSGTAENFSMALSLLNQDNGLLWLVVINGALVGLAHAFGYAIIKYEDAVLQTTITLTIILTTWLFFLVWPYQGHEEFNPFTLLGMVILGTGSYWYVVADHKQNKQHSGHDELDEDISQLDHEAIASNDQREKLLSSGINETSD